MRNTTGRILTTVLIVAILLAQPLALVVGAAEALSEPDLTAQSDELLVLEPESPEVVSETEEAPIAPPQQDVAITPMATTTTPKTYSVGTAAQLKSALGKIKSGDIIKLTKSFTYSEGIKIDGKKVTFNLNGFTLTVKNTTGTNIGLEVINAGKVLTTGTGKLNVTGSNYAIYADRNATVKVTNVTGINGPAIHVTQNSTVSVTGNVKGNCSVFDSKMTVNGTITAVGDSDAVRADHSNVTVGGSVISDFNGVYAEESTVLVKGSVTGKHTPISAMVSKVTINGNVTGGDTGSIGIYSGMSTVLVKGNLNAKGSGYALYTSGADKVTVNGNVSGSGVVGIYAAGGTALVKGNLTMTGTTAECAILAHYGGKATVEKNVTCAGAKGIEVYDSGSTVTVNGNVTSSGASATALDVYDDGAVTVKGAVNATGASSCAIEVILGKATVEGNVSCAGTTGVAATGGMSYVTIKGNLTMTKASSTAILGDMAVITVNGNVTSAGTYAVHATGSGGVGASVTVGGNITNTSTDSGVTGIFCEKDARVFAKRNVTVSGPTAAALIVKSLGEVTVDGNVTATGLSGVGVYANGGTATILGIVDVPAAPSATATWVQVGAVAKTLNDFDPALPDPGFYTYRSGTSTVKVTGPIVAVSSIRIQPSLNLVKGKTKTLPAMVQPYNATNKDCTFKSSNTAVATVNPVTGLVKGIKVGTATITVTSKQGAKTATCTVKVVASGVALQSVAALPTKGLLVGQTLRITPKPTPLSATGLVPTFTSSNPAVAVIDKTGTITALSLGKTTISAKVGTITKSFTLTVGTVLPTKIVLSSTALTVNKGATKTLAVKTWTPTNADPKTVMWKSSNTAVATVTSAGVVKGIKAGTATITAKTWNGKTATCTVTVK